MTIEIVLTGTMKDADQYRALAGEMCKAVSSEPGTLRYDWQAAPDGAFRNVEDYADGAAFLAHFGAAQQSGMLDRYLGLVDIERVDVHGEVTAEARDVLTGLGAHFFDDVASLSA